jgi:hypothetical protein
MKESLLTQFKAFVKQRSPLEAILQITWDTCAIGDFARARGVDIFPNADAFAVKVCFGVPALYELLNTDGTGTVLDGEEIIFSVGMRLDTYGQLAAIIDDPEQASRDHIEKHGE